MELSIDDDEGTKMRVVAFGDVVDKFISRFEIGKQYYVSNCLVKEASKVYRKFDHLYELHLTQNTEVTNVE